VKQLTGRKYRFLVTIVCGCAFSLFGYDQALYGGVASGDAFVKQFNHPSPSLTGQIAALYDIGCLVGSLFSLTICQKLGYRKIIVGPLLSNLPQQLTDTSYMGVRSPLWVPLYRLHL
jgi:hypothetical protein